MADNQEYQEALDRSNQEAQQRSEQYQESLWNPPAPFSGPPMQPGTTVPAIPSNFPQFAGMLLSPDPSIGAGQQAGIQRGMQLYGLTPSETGAEMKDIIRSRRERLTGRDPVTSAIRQRTGTALREARSRGASPQEMEQIKRQSQADVEKALYTTQTEALSDYQKLMGNISANQASLEMGFASLGKAGEYVAPPQPTGFMGTVICTELYKQGLLSKEDYLKESYYGIKMMTKDPELYWGYRTIADPIVVKMTTNKLLTKFIAFFVTRWIKHSFGKENAIGRIVDFVGRKICRFVGKKVVKRYGVQYA